MRTTTTIYLSNVTDVEHIDDWTTRLHYTDLNGNRRTAIVDNASLSRLDKYGYVHASVWVTPLDEQMQNLTGRMIKNARITQVDQWPVDNPFNDNVWVRQTFVNSRFHQYTNLTVAQSMVLHGK